MKEGLYLILSKLTQVTTAFAGSILLTRYMGMDQRGNYFHILSFISVLVPIINIGFAQSIQYYTARKEENMSLIAVHIFFVSILGGFIVFWFTRFQPLVAIYVIFSLIYLNLIKLLVGKKLLSLFAITEMIKPLVLLMIIVLLQTNININTLLFCNVLILGLLSFFIVSSSNIKLYTSTFGQINFKMYPYALKSWVTDVLNRGTAKLDIFLLGLLLPMESLSIYANIFILAESIWIVTDALGPKYFHAFLSKNISLSNVMIVSGKMTLWALFLGLGLYVVMRCGFIDLLYDIRYIEINQLLHLGLIGTLMLIPAKVFTKLLAARGRMEYVAYLHLFGVIAGLIVLYLIKASNNLMSFMFINMSTYVTMSIAGFFFTRKVLSENG